MLRVNDEKESRNFYENLLGMTFVAKRDFPNAKFSLLFFAYLSDSEQQTFKATEGDESKTWENLFAVRHHCIELTVNWEQEPGFKGYCTGNEKEHKGFGHICIVVPDVDATVEYLKANGVKILKEPNAGSMKGLAFVADPTGYWVEIVKQRGQV